MSRLQALRHRTALCGVLAGALAGPALGQPSAPFATQTSNGTTPTYVVAGTTGTVGLTAPRTIIDWRDFSVANGETLTFNFQARSDIVLNRLNYAQARIDGTLNSYVGGLPGGNVWISAPDGVIFGPASQVNVGGLLATTASLTNTAAFLNPTTSRFAFAFTGTGFPSGTAFPAGSGYGGVSVQTGARLQSSGGLLALIAPFVSVASGASVGGGATGDVLVGGADAFTVALQQETAGDLDMLEFVIDTPTDVSTPIAIQGSLAGRNVYVATLAPSTLMNAVIIDTGPLAATRASNGTGGTIILSSGADTITPNAQPTLSTSVTAGIAPVTIGDLTAQNHAYIYSSGDLTAQAASTLSGGAATIGVGGNATVATVDLTGPFVFAPIPGAVVPQFTATGPIAAGSVSVVRAGAIDVGSVTARSGDVTLQSIDSGGQGYDAVTAGTVAAQGSVDIEGRNVTAASVTATSGGATIRAVTPRTPRGPPVFADVGSLSLATASVVEAQQGYASVGDVTFTGASGGGTLAVSAPAGRVYVGYAPGGSGSGGGSGAILGLGRLTLTARDNVALDAQGSPLIDAATSELGSVALTADALSVGRITAAVNASLLAKTGELSATQVQAGGPVTLSAPAGAIRAGSLSGDSVTVSAAGAAQVGDATTASTQDGRIRVSGSSVSITTAEPVSDLIATATAGPATVGDVTAGGDITISAAGGAASLRSAAFTSAGFTYDLSAMPGVLRMTATGAGGDVLVGPTGGSVTGATGIDLDAARDVIVQVAGPIRLTSVSAGRNVALSAQDPDSPATGALTVDRIDAVGDIEASASGALVLTDVTPGASLSGTGASLTLGVLRNAPPADLTLVSTATGFARATPLSAGGNVTINAAGPLPLSDVTAGTGRAILTGSTVDAGAVSARTSSAIAATGGGITLNSAQVSSPTGGLTLAASGPIQATTLRAGGDIAATAGGLLSASEITSANGAVTLTGSTVDAGPVSAATGGAVRATGGGITLTSAQVSSSTGGLTLAAQGPIQAATLTAGGAITASTTPGATPGGAYIDIGTLSGASASFAAGDGYVSVTTATVAPGGLLDVSASGPKGSIFLGYASGGSRTGAGTGSLTGEAALRADADVAVDVQGAAALRSATAGGDATVAAHAVTLSSASAGALTLTARTDDVSVGGAIARADFTANAPAGSISVASLTDAGVTLVTAAQDVSLGIASTGGAGGVTAGRDLAVTGLGAVDLGGAALSAGRDATLSSAGLFSLGSLSATRAARIVAGDLALNGALTSQTVAIEAATGAITVGDGAAGAGLALSAAEFGRIRAAGSLSLYAGSTTGTLRGDLAVGDLTLDPAAVPSLGLYAAAGHVVSVTGALAPVATGGGLTIGGSLTSGWRPASVLVSGSLGAATFVSETQFTRVRAFDRIALNATGDILIGSPRFITAVQGTLPSAIDIAANRPGGLTAMGAEAGRVSLVAGTLAVATDGKVVQQNTSGSPFTYSGTYLIGSASSSGTVLTVDPPSVLDLFGSYVGADGRTATGRLAARGSELNVAVRAAGAEYRFNGCEIGSLGACGVSEVVGPEQGLRLLDAQQAAVLAAVTTRQQELTESALIDDDPQAQAQDQLDPVVTGAGNEEIWRTRRKGSQ